MHCRKKAKMQCPYLRRTYTSHKRLCGHWWRSCARKRSIVVPCMLLWVLQIENISVNTPRWQPSNAFILYGQPMLLTWCWNPNKTKESQEGGDLMNSGPKKGAATWGLGCFDKGTCICQGPCSSTVDSSVLARAPLVAVRTILDGHNPSCGRPYVPCTSSNKGPSRYYQKMLRRYPALWESMLMRSICCTTHVMKFLAAWLVRTSFSFMRLTNMSLEALVHTL